MKVLNLMVHRVKKCRAEDSLNRAAQLMWDGDCGLVPVVSEDSRPIGIITDRDICMAAYTRGLPLQSMNVLSVMTREVISCRPDDDILFAENLMRKNEIRRLPVIDADGRLIGIISLNDIVREALRERRMDQARGIGDAEVIETLATIGTPRITVPVDRAAAA